MDKGELVGGRYRLRDVLGSGGMAHAWRADDEELGRPAVVKTPRFDFGAEDGYDTDDIIRDRAERLGRFRREADLLSRLRHPGIPEAYGAGDHQGQPYIAMQFIDGQTLHDFLREHWPLPVAAAIAIATQVATALDAAHQLRIVHRDLKPHNILLAHSGRVFVIDFGIAKPLWSDATRYTSAGSSIGSTGYKAPEQLLEDTITPQTDLYVLGCVLHLLLTGQPPFIATKERGSIVRQHLHEAARSLTTHGVHVPDELDRLVLHLLEKTANKRPTGAAKVVAAMARYLPRLGDPAPDPVLTPDPTLFFRTPEAMQASDAPPRNPGRTSPQTMRHSRPSRFVTRAQATDRLTLLLDESRAGDLDAACARFAELLQIAERSFGNPDQLVDRIRLGYADSLRLAGECARAAAIYTALDDALLSQPGRDDVETTGLVLCARLGAAESLAALDELQDGGLAALREAAAHIPLLPEQLAHDVARRCRAVGVQLQELGYDDEEARRLLAALPEPGEPA